MVLKADSSTLMAYDLPLTAHWRKAGVWVVSTGLNLAATLLVAMGKLGRTAPGGACAAQELNCDLPGELEDL